MADNVLVNPGTGVSEAVVVAFDDAGEAGKVQLVKLAASADGSASALPADVGNGLDVDVTRLPGTAQADLAVLADQDFATEVTLVAARGVLDAISAAVAHGTFGYAAGVAPGTVDVPVGARVRRVAVRAGASAATVTIAGGATITVLAGDTFDDTIPGDATAGGDVVIGGGVASYYVAWTV